MSNSSYDETSQSSEGDGEIKEEIDPWATMIDNAKWRFDLNIMNYWKRCKWKGKKKV